MLLPDVLAHIARHLIEAFPPRDHQPYTNIRVTCYNDDKEYLLSKARLKRVLDIKSMIEALGGHAKDAKHVMDVLGVTDCALRAIVGTGRQDVVECARRKLTDVSCGNSLLVIEQFMDALYYTVFSDDLETLSMLLEIVGPYPLTVDRQHCCGEEYEANLCVFAARCARVLSKTDALVRIIRHEPPESSSKMKTWIEEEMYLACYYGDDELLEVLLSHYPPSLACVVDEEIEEDQDDRDIIYQMSGFSLLLDAAVEKPHRHNMMGSGTVDHRDDAVVKLLLEHPSCKHVWDSARGRKALEDVLRIAAEGGLCRVASLLVRKGADPNIRHVLERDSPLYHACRFGNVCTARQLYMMGARFASENERNSLLSATVPETEIHKKEIPFAGTYESDERRNRRAAKTKKFIAGLDRSVFERCVDGDAPCRV